MENVADLLTASEVAAVACVSLRDVNRVVDEHILPPDFMRPRGNRNFEVAGCALIAFYFGTAKRLTADERRRMIGQIAPKLLAAGINGTSRKSDWAVQDELLTIDLGPFLKAARKRLGILGAARARVTATPDVLGGAPVVTGTRVPVHDVAASLDAGKAPKDVLAGYPSLKAADLELCKIYADAYPLRGRPRHAAVPVGATARIARSIPRRKAG